MSWERFNRQCYMLQYLKVELVALFVVACKHNIQIELLPLGSMPPEMPYRVCVYCLYLHSKLFRNITLF